MKKIVLLPFINSFILFVAAQPTPGSDVGIGTTTPILNKIIELKPAVYEMNHNNSDGKKSTGIIAQDVKKIFP